MQHSYIGQKGYTIAKSSLTEEELSSLKEELTLSPKEGFSIKKPNKSNVPKIPVYRENSEKIYVPRFFGETKYGVPDKSKLSDGDPIDVPFTQSLRDYQTKTVKLYLDHVTNHSNGGGGILQLPCGFGKTICALYISSQIKTKTIILVHKEFLMNQWIERIRDFLPTARVGIIQAGKFEIENKDIVIGMIQTLYSRDYPMNTFSSFGLTVIDEVHRIGSEEFSKTLTKVVTKYMLGISATVERKDGLTDILYMYIGPKVYEEERKDEDVVQVRAIQYEDPNNIEFNTVEYDFRGNVKYSTMVSRISDHLPRCEFLVQVLQDLVTEDESKQIMVLSHKRDLLAYIHDEVETKQIASCGFYVGGMKQAQLQATESKHIVLATYAMAAEALDIKTLNTLVMVSPKTDVIQSVGRILRTRSDGKIIVDIVDPHDVFQNQWKKRRTFYNKSNYQIRVIKHEDYDGMMMDPTKWKLYQARRKKGDKDSDEEKPKCLIAIESSG
jgi:superfamily II DNA or RNA helicase